MRIGIDFDNTIICYDDVFSNVAKLRGLVPADFEGSKREVRDYLRKLPDGENNWMKLQGKVYGEYIDYAAIFDGFKDFITEAKKKNIDLYIVSHKTVHGHFDEKKINLRDAALAWLKEHDIVADDDCLIPRKNVYFAPTREEKIDIIKELGCTHFIDDLEEVLFAPTFPAEVDGLHFVPTADKTQDKQFKHWNDIKDAFFKN